MQEGIHKIKFPLADLTDDFGMQPRVKHVQSGNYWSGSKVGIRAYYLSFPVIGDPRVSYRGSSSWHLNIYPKLYVQ